MKLLEPFQGKKVLRDLSLLAKVLSELCFHQGLNAKRFFSCEKSHFLNRITSDVFIYSFFIQIFFKEKNLLKKKTRFSFLMGLLYKISTHKRCAGRTLETIYKMISRWWCMGISHFLKFEIIDSWNLIFLKDSKKWLEITFFISQ